MNKAILIGRLTKDIELRKTNSGQSAISNTIAVNRKYTNQNGEKETDFINIVVFGVQADNLNKYCEKGSQIAVEGRIQTRNYEDNKGNKKYVTEVVAENITFLNSKRDTSVQSENENKEEYQPESMTMDDIEIDDEMLPF